MRLLHVLLQMTNRYEENFLFFYDFSEDITLYGGITVI